MLGSIGSGVDFEKRIAADNTTNVGQRSKIEQAFDALQAELQEQISEKMLKAPFGLVGKTSMSLSKKS